LSVVWRTVTSSPRSRSIVLPPFPYLIVVSVSEPALTALFFSPPPSITPSPGSVRSCPFRSHRAFLLVPPDCSLSCFPSVVFDFDSFPCNPVSRSRWGSFFCVPFGLVGCFFLLVGFSQSWGAMLSRHPIRRIILFPGVMGSFGVVLFFPNLFDSQYPCQDHVHLPFTYLGQENIPPFSFPDTQALPVRPLLTFFLRGYDPTSPFENRPRFGSFPVNLCTLLSFCSPILGFLCLPNMGGPPRFFSPSVPLTASKVGFSWADHQGFSRGVATAQLTVFWYVCTDVFFPPPLLAHAFLVFPVFYRCFFSVRLQRFDRPSVDTTIPHHSTANVSHPFATQGGGGVHPPMC